jgi:hypothetical protein
MRKTDTTITICMGLVVIGLLVGGKAIVEQLLAKPEPCIVYTSIGPLHNDKCPVLHSGKVKRLLSVDSLEKTYEKEN